MILSSKVAWWKEEWRLGRDFFMQVPLALAAALQLDRPVFIGSSIGGMLAVDLARYHPQEFRAVIGLEVRHMHDGRILIYSVACHVTGFGHNIDTMALCNVLFLLVVVAILVRVCLYRQAAIATPSREGPADRLQKEEGGHSAEVRASSEVVLAHSEEVRASSE